MADDLDISLRSLYTLVDAGLPHIKRGRLLWFDRAKVLSWLEQFERIERKGKRPSKVKRDLEAVNK